MTIALIVNGSTYQYPENGDVSWGTQATNWAAAITNSTLQPTGGTFTLTNDVNFGINYGVQSKYYKSISTNVSGSGIVRLSNTDTIAWRNGANTADLPLTVVSDNLRFNNAEFVTTAGSQALSNKTYAGTSLTLSGGTALTTTNHTGTGSLVLATAPTILNASLTTPTITSATMITPSIGVATGTSLNVSGSVTANSLVLGGGTALTTTNHTGTGSLVLATSPTITTATLSSPTMTTPVLGVATATSINKVTITAPTSSATLTIANGGSLTTTGAHSITLSSTGLTSITLPTSGTLSTVAGTETLSNKTFTQLYTADNTAKMLQPDDFISDTIVYGLIPPVSGTLSSTHPDGVGYVAGVRVIIDPKPKTYTASRDTYVDVTPTGSYVYTAVTLGAAAPAITSPNMRICKVVTDGTTVSSVVVLKGAATNFGFNAGGNITTGYNNVNYGENAGASITTGYENANFGFNAGESITDGFTNVNFGPYAGNTIISGYENINIGAYAGQNTTFGYENVCIGPEAGASITSGDTNVCIGYQSGVTATPANATTTGGNNVFIGVLTGSSVPTQLYGGIAIGYGATVSRSGEYVIGTLGTIQQIPEGEDAAMGIATLVAGTVTVINGLTRANSRIFLTTNVPGGTVGTPYISDISAGTSFTITSTSGADTSQVAWHIINPQ